MLRRIARHQKISANEAKRSCGLICLAAFDSSKGGAHNFTVICHWQKMPSLEQRTYQVRLAWSAFLAEFVSSSTFDAERDPA